MVKWKKIAVGMIADVIAGQSPPSSTYNYEGRGLPFFQGKADFGTLYPTTRVWCDAPLKIAKPNDILISVRAPVGPTNLCQTEACIGRGLSAIRVNNDTDYKYVLYYLRAIEPKLSSQGRGSTFSAITQSEIRNITIPLPPLPIQKQIAAILEKADAAREKRRQANQLTEQFLQSAFLEMFGDPVKNAKGWERKRFNQLCDIRRGASPRPIDKFMGGTIPWIKIGDGSDVSNIFIERTAAFVTEGGAKKSVFVPSGSLIFANCGVSLGFARIMKIGGCIHDGWLSLSNLKQEINNIYLLSTINMLTGYFRRIAPGGTQPNLNTEILGSTIISVPPIDEQQKYAALVEKVDSIRTKQKESEKELDNLFQSLMQRAFNGELVSG
jgi:type I restriction enzyme S subunit